MNLEDLTPEQKEKAFACKTPEELLALAQEEGYEPSEEELQSLSGGWGKCDGYVDDCYSNTCAGDFY